MGKRRRELLPLTLMSGIASCALLLAGAPVASAGPLDGVTGPVKEVTTTVNETVEEVVQPVVTPPPSPAPESPPPVKVPEVQVPELPVKVPSPPVKAPSSPTTAKPPSTSTNASPPSVPKIVETAKQTADAATGAVVKAAGTTTSLGTKGSGEAERVVETGAGKVQRTTSAQTSAGAPAVAPGGRSTVDQDSSAGTPSEGLGSDQGNGLEPTSAPRAASGSGAPGVLRGIPVSLRPFVYVWPAVALVVAEGPLVGFLQRWAQALLARYQGEGGSGSPALGSAPTIGEPVSQPEEGKSPEPAPPPFASNLNPGDSENPLLALLLLIPIAAILFTLAFRYEEGHPLLPRRLTRWRR